ncbi:hypothetical protein, partial [Pseudomarimonas arenosa]|uniref:hypothetical protein n=1 Tax=Pseudomarimonas arenosa TaxID=2774145 RepID=UPI001CDC962B
LLRSNGYFVACAFATLGRLLRSNGYFVACAFATLGRLLSQQRGTASRSRPSGPTTWARRALHSTQSPR